VSQSDIRGVLFSQAADSGYSGQTSNNTAAAVADDDNDINIIIIMPV